MGSFITLHTQRTYMGETADQRLPVTESTKDRIDERKPDGMTYDLWVRTRALGDNE